MTVADDLATRYGLKTALSIPPADCTNSCGTGPCNCSGEFRARAYSKESVDAALDRVEAEIARLNEERDAALDRESGASDALDDSAAAYNRIKARAAAAEAELARLRDGLRRFTRFDLHAADYLNDNRVIDNETAYKLIEDIEFARALLAEDGAAQRGEPCECGRPTSVCKFTCDFCTGGSWAEDGAA